MNLFALVAGPIVAREVSIPLERRWPAFHARWREIISEQNALKSPLLFLPALCVLFVALSVAGIFGFPRSLDGKLSSNCCSCCMAASFASCVLVVSM